jgi:hypothetical protein
MVQLLFARLPQFKDDNTSISSTKRVKDLSTKNINHQRVNSKSFINEQQINRKIILFFHCFFFKVFFIESTLSTTETNLTYVSFQDYLENIKKQSSVHIIRSPMECFVECGDRKDGALPEIKFILLRYILRICAFERKIILDKTLHC